MFKGPNKQNIRPGSVDARDDFAAAPPGISLTTDNANWPWGNPPQEVDVDVILEEATNRIEDDEVFRDEMMKLLLAGVSVEHLVETWVMDGFQNGKFSLDAGLIAKGPLAMYIAYVAEEMDIPYRMFEKEDPTESERMDDVTYFRLMKTNNPQMFNRIREELNRGVRMGLDAYEESMSNGMDMEPEMEDEQQGFMEDRSAS